MDLTRFTKRSRSTLWAECQKCGLPIEGDARVDERTMTAIHAENCSDDNGIAPFHEWKAHTKAREDAAGRAHLPEWYWERYGGYCEAQRTKQLNPKRTEND